MRILPKIILSVGLLVPAIALAQIVPAQNQQVVTPYGGFIVATSTSGTSKLSATSTPYFANFFAANGNITNLTVGNCTGCSSSTFGTSSLSAIWPIIYTQSASLAQFSFGGLGTSTPAVQGNIPYFSGVNTFANVATTTASCSGTTSCSAFTVIGNSPITISSSGSTVVIPVSTSTNETAGQLSYWTTTSGTPAKLGQIATGTLSASVPLAVTAGRSVVGGAATLSITQSGSVTDGYLSSVDWNTFNNKISSTSLSGTSPITYTPSTGVIACPTCSVGASPYPFIPGTYNAQPTSATSTAIQILSTVTPYGLIASSTFLTYASTTQLSVSGNLYLPSLTVGTLNVNATGLAYKTATSTPTVTGPITYSGTLGQFIAGSSGAFGCTTCVVTTLTLTVAGTSNQITSSAGAQDLSANRTWTLSLPNLVIFPNAASSTLFSNIGTAYFGATATSTFSSTGKLTLANTANILVIPNLGTPAGTFLAADPSGNVIATTSPTGGASLTGSTGQTAYFSGTNTAVGTSTIFITTGSRVGISTTTPPGLLTVNSVTNTLNAFTVNNSIGSTTVEADTLDTAAQIFAVATSSGATYFAIDKFGHLITGGTTPGVSSCGTSPSVVGDDNSMEITVGSVAATGCTITFANVHTNAPICVVTNQSMSIVNAMTYTISTSQIAVSQTGLTGDKLDILCHEHQ